MSALGFELAVGQILEDYFPHASLADVNVFRPDTREDHLWTNQIDHLLHLRRGHQDLLVLIECKNQQLTGALWQEPPTENSVWNAWYADGPSDVKGQTRRQLKALRAFLDDHPEDESHEIWVVQNATDSRELVRKEKRRRFLHRLLNGQQLKNRLAALAQDGWCGVPVVHSPLLWPLRSARGRANAFHPPFSEALPYIDRCRQSLDREIFARFDPRHERWAIKGAAGSGKSVLLAYALAVFSTNKCIRVVQGLKTLQDWEGQYDGEAIRGLPLWNQRNIVCYAMTDFQREVLRKRYAAFLEEFAVLAEGHAPAARPCQFHVWNGQIQTQANIVAVDESHNLSLVGQQALAEWAGEVSNRYVLIALDRQQQVVDEGARAHIVQGLPFGNSRCIELNRAYRQPFPVFIASLALMFRWFSAEGPMIRPEEAEVPGDGRIFRGGYGVRVLSPNAAPNAILAMRNDSHPANVWQGTISKMFSAKQVLHLLETQSSGHENVLWLRFAAEQGAPENLTLQGRFNFHNIGAEQAADFIARNIQGLEFPIVVIEGLPPHFNNLQDPHRMLNARRQFYLCASRASGFLYLVPPHGPVVSEEITGLLRQLQAPVRERNAPGLTWMLRFNWRQPIGIEDYQELLNVPVQALPDEAEEADEAPEDVHEEQERPPQAAIPDVPPPAVNERQEQPQPLEVEPTDDAPQTIQELLPRYNMGIQDWVLLEHRLNLDLHMNARIQPSFFEQLLKRLEAARG